MKQETILRVLDSKKWFPVRKSFMGSFFSHENKFVRAVDGVSFEVRKKEIFGLVGESGCGKTTLAKSIMRLTNLTAGHIYFYGHDVTEMTKKELKDFRRKMQIIFQDPYDSLNSGMILYDIITEPLKIHKLKASDAEKMETVREIMTKVELEPPEEFVNKYPPELSGGQRQRVAIARALILQPKFLIADEPVSMLDVSTRGGILKLMLKLRKKLGLSILFITHDLALARWICDRIAVMYLGKIVEIGPAEDVIIQPKHPYTLALLNAVPIPEPIVRPLQVLKGEVPDAMNIPEGCRFHPRCPQKQEICSREEPKLIRASKNRLVACHQFVT